MIEHCAEEQLARSFAPRDFLRGDANQDTRVDISDGIAILDSLFSGEGSLDCEDAADSNDDGGLDISDAINIFGFLFLGGAPLPPPSDAPGQDPTPDLLVCS